MYPLCTYCILTVNSKLFLIASFSITLSLNVFLNSIEYTIYYKLTENVLFEEIKIFLSHLLSMSACYVTGSLIYKLRGTDPDGDILTFGVKDQLGQDVLRIENVGNNEANVYLKKELDREVTSTSHLLFVMIHMFWKLFIFVLSLF